MVNVWLGRAMTYDIVSAALVSGPATSMTAMMQCLPRLLVKSSVYMGEWCECAFM